MNVKQRFELAFARYKDVNDRLRRWEAAQAARRRSPQDARSAVRKHLAEFDLISLHEAKFAWEREPSAQGVGALERELLRLETVMTGFSRSLPTMACLFSVSNEIEHLCPGILTKSRHSTAAPELASLSAGLTSLRTHSNWPFRPPPPRQPNSKRSKQWCGTVKRRNSKGDTDPMKRAIVYRRKDIVLVHSSSPTDQGVWVITGPCTKLASGATDDEIGTAVWRALEESRTILHPTSWSALFEPVLQAAGVGSWRTFMSLARSVEVEMDGDRIVVVPTRNLGTADGFEPIPGAGQGLDAPGAASLGATVRDMLEKAT